MGNDRTIISSESIIGRATVPEHLRTALLTVGLS
jgi:hypothetical protein